MAERFNVKAAREEMGLTRRQLARQSPFSLRSIQKWESPSNTDGSISKMALAHLKRQLDEHRQKVRGHARAHAQGNGHAAHGTTPAAPATSSSGSPSGPRRRSLSDKEQATPTATVRAFGRPG